MRNDRLESSLYAIGADMKLVDEIFMQRQTEPVVIVPGKRVIDYL